MPSSSEWRSRNDSVADHLASIHARTKQVVPASAVSNRTSYSLYPPVGSPSSPISPIDQLGPSDLPPRPPSTSRETVILSAPSEHESISGITSDTQVEDFEPLVDDFFSQLASTPQASGRDNLLPGLGNGIHRRLPKVSGMAALPPEVSRARPHAVQSLNTAVKRISRSDHDARSSSIPTTPEDFHGSSTGAVSEASTASSEPPLVPLQTHGIQTEFDRMSTINVDDPANYNLLTSPPSGLTKAYNLEDQAIKLFSRDHLKQIFLDPKLLVQFASFLETHRPRSVRLLMFYFDAVKAGRALAYSNAVAQALAPVEGHDFSTARPPVAVNFALDDRAHKAFDALASDDLAAFIAHTWTNTVSHSVHKRVTGTLAPHLREASEGLAEVFCLSDPARPDNPIVFASAQFQRTTQYGMNHCVGRNCRFLQGPQTDPRAVRRIRDALAAGKEHTEVFVNYRRDGQPFMNLLMTAPLHDARGTIRYFIGAQVDVSGLAKDATGLEGLRRLLRREKDAEFAKKQDEESEKDDFRSLAEMFNKQELDIVHQHGGHMHSSHFDDLAFDDGDVPDHMSVASDRPRLLITDDAATAGASSIKDAATIQKEIAGSGRLQGVYQHYLLIRPAPSLRILFTSPSLRIPGILQTPFLARIGGSAHVRGELANAFAEGRSVTAKVRWLPRPGADDEEGRSRWIHATPLLNHKAEVGVWMVVLVDATDSHPGDGKRRFHAPPPVITPMSGRAESQRSHLQPRSSMRSSDRGSRHSDRPPGVQHHQRLTVGGTPILAVTGPAVETADPPAGDARYEMAATYMPTRADSDPRKTSALSFFDDAEAYPPRRTVSAQSRRSAGGA